MRDYKQCPREVQAPPSDDYIASLWWNAVNLYNLAGERAAEYVRLERALDAFQDPVVYEAQHERYLTLCRRLEELTRPALSRAA